jgi:DNA-binding Lrp family transcriptional regulator
VYELDLDRIDRRILEHLQGHARASNLELAQAANLSPAQCHRRHRRLEEASCVSRYETRLNAARMG